MAYADWQEFLAQPNRTSNSLATFNVSLSNPLTDTGTYCRRWVSNANRPNVADYIPQDALDGGAWVGTDTANALSIRGWLRSSGGGEGGGSVSMGGMALMLSGDNAAGDPDGYNLIIGDGQGISGTGFQTLGTGLGPGAQSYVFGLTLYMKGPGGTKAVYIRDELGTGIFDNFLISRNRWYRVRMDVIPQGAALDIIKVYMDDSGGGSPGTVITGSENWTLLHTENVFNNVGWFRGASASYRVHVQQGGWHSTGGFDPFVDGHADAVELLKASV